MKNPNVLWLSINAIGLPAAGFLSYLTSVEIQRGFVAVFMELASTNHLPGPWAAKNWPVFTTQGDKEEFENVLNVYGSLKKKLFDSPAMGQ